MPIQPVLGTILVEHASLSIKKNGGFNPDTFLATIGDGRKILTVPNKQTIFAQGDEADAVFYVQKGKVRLTVVPRSARKQRSRS